ncbi:MAG: iron-containing alcohol dehydrogenase [Candidatus Odinarchaeota archaeon]
MQLIQIPRRFVYGKGAISRLEATCESIGLNKSDRLVTVSGSSATKRIAEAKVLPLIEDSYQAELVVVENDNLGISGLETVLNSLQGGKATLIACGGGRVMDLVKIAASITSSSWISFPTSASHDGFSSPFIGYLLRQELEKLKKGNKGPKYPDYDPISPIAIVADIKFVKEASYSFLAAGFCDLIAKRTAYADWQLANRLRGEYFDEHAATFGLFSGEIAEKGIKLVANGHERGFGLVVQALGNSGIAMSLAGNSRPASGSEHLISHYLDTLSIKHGLKSGLHGFQVGLATIITSYLHAMNWEKVKALLEQVKAPVTVKELGIDREILLDALLNAHKIRPDRYTILGDGLNREAAENAVEVTGTG